MRYTFILLRLLCLQIKSKLFVAAMTTKTKKLCPRVTLKTSNEMEPLICTASNVAKSKTFKTKTEFTCYQNTSDLSNPRLTAQRMLVMDCDGIQSVGKSWETKVCN